MIRTNLATRPFYNERAVYMVLGLVALVGLVVLSVEAGRIIELSRLNRVKSHLPAVLRPYLFVTPAGARVAEFHPLPAGTAFTAHLSPPVSSFRYHPVSGAPSPLAGLLG